MLLFLLACNSEWSSVALEAPHVSARPGFDGEACAEMALRRLGYPVDQDDVFDASGVDPILGRGQNARELRETLSAIGFSVGTGWYRDGVEEQWAALHADLVDGLPSVVYLRTGEAEEPKLVLGYSFVSDMVLLDDPTLGALEIPRARFLDRWELEDGEGRFTVRFRLAPAGSLAVPPEVEGIDAAAMARAVRHARQEAPIANMSLQVVPPFVLMGDEPEATVDARAVVLARTIDLFRADYFETDLAEPWEIWAMRGPDTYRRTTLGLFGEEPTTPYGFADGTRHALVMDISLGGGTLVHELAHPYLNADIPWIPTWFNEGFASLFEQVGEEDGHLVGYLNWRLGTLQSHLKQGDVPTLEAFMAQDVASFRGERVALNYAMARYLCMYLQEQGLLQRYYRELKAHPEDPTGYRTFARVVGDEGDFQRLWEGWVADFIAP